VSVLEASCAYISHLILSRSSSSSCSPFHFLPSSEKSEVSASAARSRASPSHRAHHPTARLPSHVSPYPSPSPALSRHHQFLFFVPGSAAERVPGQHLLQPLGRRRVEPEQEDLHRPSQSRSSAAPAGPCISTPPPHSPDRPL
jgi:hypothetical protein